MFKRWLYVFATSFTLVFFSEILFWGTLSAREFLVTWFFYALVTYLFLATVVYFRVNTPWSLFLAGALYGWLVEGVLVQTTYENLPLSISNTGLSWHALLSVWVGWYAMRRALLAKRPFPILLLSTAVGLFWGVWMPFWEFLSEPGTPPISLERMALLAILFIPALAFSYWLQNRLTPFPFTPSRIEIGLTAGLMVIQFLFTTVPAYPIALLLLPALLLLIFWGLRRNRQTAPPMADYLVQLAGEVQPLNYLTILVIIPTALAAFALDEAIGLTPLPAYAIYAVTVPAGFLLLIFSLIKIWRQVYTQEIIRTGIRRRE